MVHKLGRSLKFPYYNLEHHHKNSEAISASLSVFHSKISTFINQILLKPEPGSEFTTLARIAKCFDLLNISNMAFAHMVVEMDYPMSKWGEKAIEEYLNYSINLLDLINSISSSISHLNQAKSSTLHALNMIENSATKNLKKITINNLGKALKLKSSTEIEEFRSGEEKERLTLQALRVLKKIGFLSLGFVLSSLCNDSKPYMEVRKTVERSDDPLIEVLDSRFCEEVMKGGVKEVKEVNYSVERLSANGRCDEHVKELKRKLKVMENLIEGIEKQGNDLFSEVLATRNNVLDNIRFTGKNKS